MTRPALLAPRQHPVKTIDIHDLSDRLIADLRADAAALRAMSYSFAASCAKGTPGSEGSLIRLYFAELAKRVTAAAVDLYGIGSPQLEGGAHSWAYEYLDAYSETIAGGTAEIQRNIIGERVLGLPKGK